MSGKQASILVLHGPNLNLLGRREPHHYGSETLADIDASLAAQAREAGVRLRSAQHDGEGEMIRTIHAAMDTVDWIIINPAAYTHTSVAIRDALAAVAIPFVEVHLSNVYRREAFRRQSYFSDLAEGVISGLGSAGYTYALAFAIKRINERHGSAQAQETH